MGSTTRVLAAALTAVWMGGSLAPADAQTQGRKWFTYEQAFESTGMGAEPGRDPAGVLADVPVVSGWLDDEHYLETRRDVDGRRRVFAVNAATGSARVHRDASARGAGVQYAPDGSFSVYVRDNDLYRDDADGSKTRRLTANAGTEKHLRLSPDARSVAYTRDGNLYVYDFAAGLERQLTSDGGGVILNGDPSWVYMEEILGRGGNAFWWSPDSSKLAFMRFDDSPVPTFPIYHADGQHGRLEIQRYPKAGDANPWVRMGVVTVADARTVWMDFEEKVDHYVAWPFWSPDSRTLLVQWMNRGQDTLRVFACDPATGKKRQIVEEKQDSWVDWYKDLHFLTDGSAFLTISDVDGWEHLYLYGLDGALRRRLTTGEWRVNAIERVDDKGGWVYFTGRPGRSWDAHLLRVRLDGGEPQQLTKAEGIHRVEVSPAGTYFVDTVSTVTTPAVVTLFRGDGTAVRELGSAASPHMREYAWGKSELFTIPSGDGRYALPAWWVLPPDFSPSRRYPVIFSIYGGPDAARVHNTWQGLQPHYWAQRGVITISVDHRASGHFGKKGVALMHRQLGKWEMTDLISAAQWLRTKPFVAADRIAITGGSYGGYVTSLALTYGAAHFNYGVAAAPVTDWHLYDTVYTERYMDTPGENPEGYRQGAVLTWIGQYKGGLRLTHGTIDDNVHMQNTLQVVDWLTSNNKRFEVMIYPDSRHGLQATQRTHATRETHDYWVEHLLDGRLPDPPAQTSHKEKKPAKPGIAASVVP